MVKSKGNLSLTYSEKRQIHTRLMVVVCFFVLLFVRPSFVFATNSFALSEDALIKVTGMVSDESGQSIPGVAIIVKGTLNSTITDSNGAYVISCEVTDTLVFSSIGFSDQELAVGNRSVINVIMKLDAIILEEVVSIGYATRTKSNLTTAVATVEMDDMNTKTVNDARQALQGLTPGLIISDLSAEPGEEKFDMRVRGVTSLNNTSPLVLVDGIPMDLNSVHPNNIESISVLKDAASTAIYGSRGANGIILITTKRAKQNETLSVSYDGFYGWQYPIKLPELADTETAIRIHDLARINAGQNPLWTDEEIDAYMKGMEKYPDLYPAYNYPPKKLVHWAPIMNHSLSVSGGSKHFATSVNMYYKDSESWSFSESRYKSYGLSTNTDFFITDVVKVYVNANVRKSEYRGSANGGSQNVVNGWPLSGFAPDGSLLFGSVKNHPYLVSKSHYKGENKKDDLSLVATVGAEIKPVKGLRISADYNVVENRAHKQLNEPLLNIMDYWDESKVNLVIPKKKHNKLQFNNNLGSRSIVNCKIDYGADINHHDFNIMLGYSEEMSYGKGSAMTGFDLYNNDIRDISSTTQDTRAISNTESRSGLRSFFSRISYNYHNRYLLDITARYDGSSKFPKGRKYDFFPSASLAWRMDSESFWKSLSHIWSKSKLRVSYGVNGNQNIPDYDYIDKLSLGQEYSFDGTPVNTISYDTFAAKDLSWERTTQFDIGWDLSFLDDRISLSMDYFNKVTDGILLQLPMPGVVGLQASKSNGAKITNNGFELEAGVRGNVKDFRYSVKLNAAYVKDILTDYAGTPTHYFGQANRYVRGEGLPLWGCRAFIRDGWYQSQEEIDNGPKVTFANGKVIPGDSKYRDISGPEGKPDGKITEDDMVFIGSAIPLWNYGLNLNFEYKGFDLSMYFQGAADYWKYLGGDQMMPAGWGDHTVYKIVVEDCWSPENPDARFPVPHLTAMQNNRPAKDNKHNSAIDASYLRLKQMTLGYTLPWKWTKQICLQKVRLYVSANNLFTISRLLRDFAYDPEGTDIQEQNRPYAFKTRSWNIGLNIKF